MNFLDLKDISERHLEIADPISAQKLLHLGQVLGLQAGQRVIDFGCGFGEMLRLWGEAYGISGVGIDVRANACTRARHKFAQAGWEDRFEIIQARGDEHSYPAGAYDVAACIGATFIWEDFRGAIRGMRNAIRPDGHLAIGEAFWRTGLVPPEYARSQQFFTEPELLEITRQEGFEISYLVRSSQDDWDRYEAENWRGLLDWLAENPEHPERGEVYKHLRDSQDEYFRYGRDYLGWAIYLLRKAL